MYEYLAFWNKNEPFPSLGIGHFIWFPAGAPITHDQTFPALLDYLAAHTITLPDWLKKARQSGAPWQSKEIFDSSPQLKELRDLLQATIDLQAAFCIERLEKSWPSILSQSTLQEKARLNSYLKLLMASPTGAYAVIDYLNFKGAGTNPSERYNGIGWGLLQVMQAVPKKIESAAIVSVFAHAAEKVLEQRVANAPQEKKPLEQKWLLGWKNRIKTYRD